MISTKACSLVAKDLGLSIEGLSKAVKGKLPRGASIYDRVIVAGEKAGNTFQTEIFTFRNSDGEILKRTFNKVSDEGTSFTVRNYQKTAKGRFIHTNNFVNNKLVGTKQETIALTKYANANVVTRTCVSKEIGEWGSLDKHSIGEFVDKGRNGRQVVYDFVRDKEGLLARIPNDEFASIYLNTNKKEVARDLTQIYSKRYGFTEMPKVTTFQANVGKNGGVSGGGFIALTISDGLKLTKPEVSFNIKSPKCRMIDTGAHENWHMKQFRQLFDRNDPNIAERSIDTKAKNWWENATKNNQTPKAESKQAEKKEAYENGFIESLDGGKNYSGSEKYRENIIEKEASKKGRKAMKEYLSRIKNPKTGLFSKFNGADWERLHA